MGGKVSGLAGSKIESVPSRGQIRFLFIFVTS